MSMSDEHAAELKNELAVVCCRTEEGTILSASNLEDPAIFPDMVDSGLLTIPDNCLKIGEVIGVKLLKTIDSLTPLTPDILEGVNKMESEVKAEEPKAAPVKDIAEEMEDTEVDAVVTCEGGVLKIRIEEGKGIDIELPF